MSDLQQDLDDLGPDPAVRAFVEDLAQHRGVYPDRQSDYVSLRPGSGGAIAVYVHRRSLSVACRPADAALRLVPALRLEDRGATVYLHADLDVLTAHRPALRTLATEALAWRTGTADTTSSGPAGSSAPAPPSCPVCFTVRGPHGTCNCDD